MNSHDVYSASARTPGKGAPMCALKTAAVRVCPPAAHLFAIARGEAPSTEAHAAAGDPRGFMECDISAQAAWLMQQASSRGYADLQDLLVGAPQLYARLAAAWRRRHPLPVAAG
ncbi:MAG: hypothetical protein R3F45_07470 [Gammaproteobacteria bacterium]